MRAEEKKKAYHVIIVILSIIAIISISFTLDEIGVIDLQSPVSSVDIIEIDENTNEESKTTDEKQQKIETSSGRDCDKDGILDRNDAFPYDASEWKDSDQDGIGDNTDMFSYDFDNDGFDDSVDLVDGYDVAVKISFDGFQVVDEVDIWPSGDAEVYFEVYVNNMFQGRIDDYGESFVSSIGSYHQNQYTPTR